MTAIWKMNWLGEVGDMWKQRMKAVAVAQANNDVLQTGAVAVKMEIYHDYLRYF